MTFYPNRPQAVRQIKISALPSMDDTALLRLLLNRSSGGREAGRLADELIGRFGGLGEAITAEAVELDRVDGLGPTAMLDLKLVRELSVRLTRSAACAHPVVASWSALLAYVRVALAHLPREQFRVLYLDRRNNLLRDELVAEGTVDHAPVYPREVIRRALELSASALILVHNHPSGDPSPSQADISMTRQIMDAARVFSLQVHDHIIVGREGTASFRTLGLL